MAKNLAANGSVRNIGQDSALDHKEKSQ